MLKMKISYIVKKIESAEKIDKSARLKWYESKGAQPQIGSKLCYSVQKLKKSLYLLFLKHKFFF